MIDDLVAPRIAGWRAYRFIATPQSRAEVGATAAVDFYAPVHGSATMSVDSLGHEILPIAVLDARYRLHTIDRRLVGAVDGAIVAISTVAAGAHIAGSGTVNPDGPDTPSGLQITARGELRLGSGGYIPGWFGALYERDRLAVRGMETQLDAARAGGMAGLSGSFAIAASHRELGEASVIYDRRVSLPNHVIVRVRAPHFRVASGALWAAISTSPAKASAFAGELHIPLPRGLHARLELSRLYRSGDGALQITWRAMAAIGATLDRGAE